MWIVAIAWVYVVGLMALAEMMKTSVVGGIMTFVFYCILPLSLVYYIAGRRKRRERNAAANPPPSPAPIEPPLPPDAG
jgi:hypothetical protein